ncbi:MAG TPA: hypothetical protein VK203_06020 [Nostocaceae cyanobacterium]|nr:hypothetical protein [Nostocaceae cyanobacterium]
MATLKSAIARSSIALFDELNNGFHRCNEAVCASAHQTEAQNSYKPFSMVVSRPTSERGCACATLWG